MSKREFVLVVSRGFALLLITCASIEVTYLPERVSSLMHVFGEQTVLRTTHDYWTNYYSLVIGLLILRVSALLLATVLFWRCGSRVQSLFTDSFSEGRESKGTA